MHRDRRTTLPAIVLGLLATVICIGIGGIPSAERAVRDGRKPPLPTKHPGRFHSRNQAGDVSQLTLRLAAAAEGSDNIPREEWTAAIAALDADALLKLLDDEDLWPELSSFNTDLEDWKCWIRLQAFREAALQRLALLDLRRGLISFPNDAAALLEASAKADGALALQIWKDTRDEWRTGEIPARSHDFRQFDFTEGIGLLPRIRMDEPSSEEKALAALARGWATSDPEAAWNAVEKGGIDHLRRCVLAGFFEGLQERGDWPAWAARLESLDWPANPFDHSSSFDLPDSETGAVLQLALRWVANDPEAALAWYGSREAEWSTLQGISPVDAFTAGTTGQGGTQKAMPARVHLYASWLNANPAAFLGWLSENDSSDDTFANLVRWTDLPMEGKIPLIGRVADPALKAELAVGLAKKAAYFGWAGPENPPEDGFKGILDRLGQLEELDEATMVRVQSIKDGVQEMPSRREWRFPSATPVKPSLPRTKRLR